MIIRSSKLREETHIREEGDKLVLTKTVDINPILEANYHARKDSQNGFSKDRSYRRVMSVPMETLMEWKREFPEILSGDREAEDRALKIIRNREENKVFWTVSGGI